MGEGQALPQSSLASYLISGVMLYLAPLFWRLKLNQPTQPGLVGALHSHWQFLGSLAAWERLRKRIGA